MDTLLITWARILKFLNAPHIVKYALFLLVQGKKVYISSTIAVSDIPLELNLGEFIEYWIFVDGSYEKEWIIEASKFVQNKSFIDIGANIGVYSLSLCKTAKKIYALEPEKHNFDQLENTIRQNSITNITPFKIAVSSQEKQHVKLYTSSKDAGWHSLSINYEGKSQQIKTVTLDSFITSNNIQNIGLIKIDVEGAEFEVLKGAQKTLTRIQPPIIIEFNRPRAILGHHSIEQLYEEFKKYNYSGYFLRKQKRIKLTAETLKKIYNENVLFLPKSFHR